MIPVLPIGVAVGAAVGLLVGAAIGVIVAPLLGVFFRSRWARGHNVGSVAGRATYFGALTTLVVTETAVAALTTNRNGLAWGVLFGLVAAGTAGGLAHSVAWRLFERNART